MGTLHDATDVYDVLVRWKRVSPEDPYRGDVREIHMLPGPSDERLIIYYPDLSRVDWDPQGKLVIFQQQAQGWRAIYDAATIIYDAAPGKDWTNWRYHVADVNSTPDDGLADVLIGISYWNGAHVGFGYTAILTGRGQSQVSPIHVAFLEQTMAKYRFQNGDLFATRSIGVMDQDNDHRQFIFDGAAFRLAHEWTDPPTGAIQLVQAMDSQPTNAVVLRRALRAILEPDITRPSLYTLSPQPDYPDETVLLDIVKLKLMQIATLDETTPYPDIPDELRVPHGFQTYTLELFRTEMARGALPPDIISTELGKIFLDTWGISHNADLACQTMAAFANQYPQKSLSLIRQASQGILKLNGEDLCAQAHTIFYFDKVTFKG